MKNRDNLDRRQYLVDLVTEALRDVDNSAIPLSSVFRKAIRIARIRSDWDALWWLSFELLDLDEKEARRRIIHEILLHYTRDLFNLRQRQFKELYIEERSIKLPENPRSTRFVDKLIGMGIERIETQIDYHLHQTKRSPYGPGNDDIPALYANALLGALTRIRTRLLTYLSTIEAQLLAAQLNSDIFEQNRNYVYDRLASLAPRTADQLLQASERLSEGEAESRSHALSSCRRALKSIADELYPPRSEPMAGADGVERKLTAPHYINRLWQFVADRSTSNESTKLLSSRIRGLGERLDAISDIASKGVHADASAFEATQCVMQSFEVIGDLLRLADDEVGVGDQS